MKQFIGVQIKQYQIEALLGEGGMGVVYRAYDLKNDRPVAIKIMLDTLVNKPQFRQRFALEAAAIQQFNSPSIVKIYDTGDYEGSPFIVMEHIEGGSLIDYLKQLQWSGRKMPLAETIALGSQIAEGLAYAHQRGLIHRDIKPGNILLRLREAVGGQPRQAVIIDFGLAVPLKEGDEAATNPFMGSLAYMSPEQCENLPLDGRSDIYSLGILLYQLTTGQLPFQINAPVDIIKHVQEPPLPPRLINPELPEIIDSIILKAMAKKASERFQTAAEMAYALRQSLTEDAMLTAVPGDGSGVVTQWLDSKWVASVTVEDRVDIHQTWTSSGGFRLFIVHQWEESQVHDLDKDVITLGRNSENDVVLADRSISGQHARMLRTPTGWQIEDLGSTNGSILAGRPLEYNTPLDWASYETARLGPYFLRWQPFSEQRKEREASATLAAMATAVAGGTAAGAFTPAQTPPGLPAAAVAAAIRPPDDEPEFTTGEILGIAIVPNKLELEPGAELPLEISVTNRDVTVKDIGLRLEVDGRQPAWIRLSQTDFKLLPEETKTVETLVSFSSDNDLLAGTHTLKIVAATDKGEVEVAYSQLLVAERENFALDMHPSNLQEKVTCRVTISDRGNFPNQYTVMGLDDSDALLFHFEEPQNAILADFSEGEQKLKVLPGQEAYVGFSLRPRKRPWFAQNKVLPFKIRIRTEKSDWHSLTGQVEIRPRISRRVLLFFLLFLLLVGGAGYLAFLQIEQAQAERLQELQSIADKANEDAAAAQARAAEAQQRLDDARAAGASAEELAALQAQADAAAQEAAALDQAAQSASSQVAEAAATADLPLEAIAASTPASTPAPTATLAPTAVPNSPPTNITFSASKLDENVSIGSVVGSFTAVDPDVALNAQPAQKPRALFRLQRQSAGFTYSLVSGTGSTDNGMFVIDGSDLKTAADIDFETKSQLSIRVQVDDGQGGTLQKSFTLSVTDIKDVPALSVANVSVAESAGKAAVSVTVVNENGDEATVKYALVAGTAKDGVDYTAVSGTLTWAKGDTEAQVIEIPILNNEMDEPNRTFSLVLSDPKKATLGTSTAIITITDDDAPPTLTISDLSVLESIVGGKATVSVVMKGSSSETVTVNYATANDTAVAGQDYTAASGALSWTAGQTGARSFEIAILQDVIDEPDETLTIALSNVQGAVLAVEKAALTISDDDAQPKIVIGDATVNEGAKSVTIPITMTGATSAEAWVDVTTQNGTLETNAAIGDGNLRDFNHLTVSVTWEPGTSGGKTITVDILDDLVDEGDDATQPEIFGVVIFSNAPSIVVQDNAATVQIFDDDAPPVVNLTAANPTTVDESAGVINLNVEMTGQSSRAVTVNFSLVEGTAVQGEDFTFSGAQQVSWAAYETGVKAIPFTIVDDKVDENTTIGPPPPTEAQETFLVRLNAPTAATLGTATETTVGITDNDQAGITLTGPAPTSIQEDPTAPTASRTAVYSVRLTSRPLSDVTFTFAITSTVPPPSPFHAQCSVVNAAPLVFTPATWNVNQTVSVRAVDESFNDQGGTCNIILSPNTADALYTLFPDVIGNTPVTVVNDDDPQILLGPTGGLLYELPISGTTSLTYTVRLSSIPTATVSVRVDPNNELQVGRSQATVGAPGVPFTLTFPTASAVISQTVFVQAVNDNVDEPQDPHIGAIVHTSSGTSDYNGLTVTDNINIVNDDVAQILLGAPGQMVLSETVGLNQSTTFTASLGSRPVSNVTLNFAASNGQCSVSPASVLFDAASATDWGVERVVTVTAVNDAFDDGDQPCTAQITVTTNDTSYQINPPDYAFTVLDDDQAGYVVTAQNLVLTDTVGLNSLSFSIWLTSEPESPVSIAYAANSKCSVSAITALDASNWDSGVWATITAAPDDIADGNVTCNLVPTVTTADPNYTTLNPGSLSVVVVNDDVAGYTAAPASLRITDTTGLNSSTFLVTLTSAPTADVTLAFSSSSTTCQAPVSDVVLNAASWQTGKPVTITTSINNIDEGVTSQPPCSITAVATSTDSAYNGLSPSPVSVTVGNDDVAGFLTSPATLRVTDTVGVNTATFNVRLTSQPVTNVNVTFASSDPIACTVSTPTALTSSNWQTGVSVTVTGASDDIENLNRTCQIRAESIAGDSIYAGLPFTAVPEVIVTVANDDQVAITMSTDILSVTDSTGANTATFTIRLGSQPTGPVTIPLLSDSVVCSVPSPQVIPAASWQTGVSVTVTAVPDNIDQGADRVCNITGGDPSSPDPNYAALGPGNVPGIRVDVVNDDTAGFVVTPTSLTITDTVGLNSATFTVRLTSQPPVTTTVTYASGNPICTVSSIPAFTAANWVAGEVVTVTTPANFVDGSNQTCALTASVSTTDEVYAAVTPTAVTVSVIDDDTAGILRTNPVPTVISETLTAPNHTATFTVTLNSQPTGTVRIPISASSANNVCSVAGNGPGGNSVDITTANWQTGVLVTITATVNNSADPNQPCTISLGPVATNNQPVEYRGLSGTPVQVDVLNDD
ncbi:MAG: protein kinase [Chloroflexi bacterium]|nr:protein kinase [Chloroflexota bacterium]